MLSVTPEELREALERPEPVQLIDVRTGAEFRGVHVRGARPHPLHRLDPEAVRAERPPDARGPTLVLCRSGHRAARAAERLAAAGVPARVVEGGTAACVAAGLPVVRGGAGGAGGAGVSLERQVRVAAGSLVAAGVGLGWSVHPLFLLLPGFVGCGLVVSGLTDTCGLGVLLARMPWNHRPDTPPEAAA